MRWGVKWTPEELAILKAGLDGPWRDLVPLIPGHKPLAVRCKWSQFRQYGRDTDAISRELATDTYDVESNVAHNNRFCAAMLKAIRAGLETAPISTVKTPYDHDFRPKIMRGDPSHFGACVLADL